MRKVSIILAGCLLFALLALITVFSLAIEETPLVNRAVILAPEHIGRAKQIVDAHRYWARPGMLATIRITPGDADLAANYLANRIVKGSAQVTVRKGNATITLSIPIASTWLAGPRYLNIKATLIESSRLPELQSLQIGEIQVPEQVSKMVGWRLEQWLRRSPEYREALDALRGIKMSQNELAIAYRWTNALPRLSREVKSSVIGELDRERFLHYHSLVAENSRKGATAISLAEVLPVLMEEAAERSRNEDPLAENRAVILVVTFHVLGLPLERLLPEAASWPRSVAQTVTLDGRDDFAKHFMVSALIAAYADTVLSDVVGLYKEIEDSRGGSGFSFNDLAADRAGTKFGEKAVAERSAHALQLRVASGIADRDLMPEWSDLPEFMPEEEFQRRFGGIGKPPYQVMMARIEERVAALEILN